MLVVSQSTSLALRCYNINVEYYVRHGKSGPGTVAIVYKANRANVSIVFFTQFKEGIENLQV